MEMVLLELRVIRQKVEPQQICLAETEALEEVKALKEKSPEERGKGEVP